MQRSRDEPNITKYRELQMYVNYTISIIVEIKGGELVNNSMDSYESLQSRISD